MTERCKQNPCCGDLIDCKQLHHWKSSAFDAAAAYVKKDHERFRALLKTGHQFTDWQQRVIQERSDLDVKIQKIEAFLDSEPKLTTEDRFLLDQQFDAMKLYSRILRRRIERFG